LGDLLEKKKMKKKKFAIFHFQKISEKAFPEEKSGKKSINQSINN